MQDLARRSTCHTKVHKPASVYLRSTPSPRVPGSSPPRIACVKPLPTTAHRQPTHAYTTTCNTPQHAPPIPNPARPMIRISGTPFLCHRYTPLKTVYQLCTYGDIRLGRYFLPAARWARKKSVRSCPHTVAFTPGTISQRWFRRGSLQSSYKVVTAPALGSVAP